MATPMVLILLNLLRLGNLLMLQRHRTTTNQIVRPSAKIAKNIIKKSLRDKKDL